MKPPKLFFLLKVSRSLEGDLLIEKVVTCGEGDSMGFVNVHHVGFGLRKDLKWGVDVGWSTHDVDFGPDA